MLGQRLEVLARVILLRVRRMMGGVAIEAVGVAEQAVVPAVVVGGVGRGLVFGSPGYSGRFSITGTPPMQGLQLVEARVSM